MNTPSRPPRSSDPRGRYANEVTPEHVRQRVSIRYLAVSPDDGSTVTDVVGRLLAFQDDTLILVDRRERLHAIDAARVVGSRVVPPHPRLPPEPDVGTREQPLVRQAARVLLLDPNDRVLLASFSPHAGETVWTTPGGGLDPGEDHEQAAARELREELGVDVCLGPWVWSRRVTFPFRGVWIDQAERWFLARTAVTEVADSSPDPGMDAVRWWTLGELRATTDQLAPARMAHHLADLFEHGPPDTPIDVGR